MFPNDGDAVVDVDEAVVVGEAEGYSAGVEAAGEAKPVAGDGGGAT